MRAARLFLLSLALSACATVPPRDGFRDTIPQGCQTEEGCRLLEAEAEARVQRCHPAGSGRVRCDEARDDLAVVRASMDRWLSQRREAERRARRDEADRKAAEERAQEDRRRQAESAAMQVAGAQERQAAFGRWRDEQIERCARTWSGEGCEAVPEGTSEGEKSDCDRACRKAADEAAVGAYDRALLSCVKAVVESEGKAGASCQAGASLAVTHPRPDIQARCDEQCGRLAQRELEEARSRAAEGGQRGGRGRRRGTESGGGDESPAGGQGILCCDGTRSPTCMSRRRGCCSHHGGVCGG